jgi:hypothetical protein
LFQEHSQLITKLTLKCGPVYLNVCFYENRENNTILRKFEFILMNVEFPSILLFQKQIKSMDEVKNKKRVVVVFSFFHKRRSSLV